MNIDDYREIMKADSSEQPATEKAVTETPAEENPKTDTTVAKVKVGEEEFTVEELARGYMRTQDYTKKTQSLAEQRKQNERAFEVYETIKDDEELIKKVGERAIKKGKKVPDSDEVINLRAEVERLRVEKDIEVLTVKYPDFNEVEVVAKAKELGTNNLEFVYKGLMSSNVKQDDGDALREQIRQEILAENQITMVGVSGKNVTSTNEEIVLTPAQAKAAKAFRMTPKEYVKNQR